MKRATALLAALVLALGLTACANTATTADTMPRGRNMYDRYTTDTADTYHGNVSTTDNGWVNGTNEPTKKPKKETTTRTKRTTTVNTDAMGAGMKG